MEKNRVKAEQDLLEFGTKSSILIEIFRLSGIYGNNKNVINQIITKKVQEHMNTIHSSKIYGLFVRYLRCFNIE